MTNGSWVPPPHRAAAALHAWLALTRWREWVQSKLPFVAAAALLLAPDAPPGHVLGALATVALWAAFGYASNEIADAPSDARAHKPNRAAALDAAAGTTFLVVTAALALASCWWWASGALAPIAVGCGLALSHAYSQPPLRLKERGLAGIVAAAAAQWLLPVAAVAGLRPSAALATQTWAAALLAFAIGIRWMAVHQLHDRDADRAAGLRTFGARDGALDALLHGAFAAELLLLGVFAAIAWPLPPVALALVAVWLANGLSRRRARPPLDARLRTYPEAPLATLYFLVLPVGLAAGRALESAGFVALAALLLLLGARRAMRIARP